MTIFGLGWGLLLGSSHWEYRGVGWSVFDWSVVCDQLGWWDERTENLLSRFAPICAWLVVDFIAVASDGSLLLFCTGVISAVSNYHAMSSPSWQGVVNGVLSSCLESW